MCGIVGRLERDPSKQVHCARILRMCDTIVHRGPDDQGQFVNGSIGLGVRRLSIIDVQGGHQPMSTPDGRLTIVFNGEIYNHRELRADLESKGHRFRTSSDTEAILHCYAQYGVESLARLNGMFAIAIWDDSRQELFLARDRIGIKPLYIYDDGKAVAFASELRALLADPTIPRELDSLALDYYLRYGYVSAPATLFHGIRKLPPAHYILIARDRSEMRQYWKPDHEIAVLPEADYSERVYDCFRRCVERQLVSDVPLGAFLSGGLDSSSLVHAMTEITGRPVHTFSIGFAGSDRFHNELPDAARLAANCHSIHRELLVEENIADQFPSLVRHLDHPIADSSFIVTYLIAQLARESVKVVMSGVGGDEIFGGYRRYLGPALGRYYGWIPMRARQIISDTMSSVRVDRGSTVGNLARLARGFVQGYPLPAFEQYDHAVRLTSEDRLRSLSGDRHKESTTDLVQRRAFFDEPAGRDPIARMMHLDLKTSLPESLLLLTDNMTMATSLEARVPFLDHELVELTARIPSSLKIKGTRLRYLQKLSMRSRLPNEVFRKRKWGFGCPVGRWFRGELRELLMDQLALDRVRRKGLFDGNAINEIIAAHEDRREDNAEILLGLLTFDMWHSEFVER
jgi:asparagine synthase (glutamine-hydrolysing)